MMPETQLEKLYDTLTTAITQEASDEEINAIIESFNVPHSKEVDSVVGLISNLHSTLVGVQPSPVFVKRLKRELLQTQEEGVVGRIRRLPARVQIAAMLVFLGGFFMIFTRRRAEDSKVKGATV
jgi:hypothetical protein